MTEGVGVVTERTEVCMMSFMNDPLTYNLVCKDHIPHEYSLHGLLQLRCSATTHK